MEWFIIPVYQPDKENNCSLGLAFVCAHDDECGSLDFKHIDTVLKRRKMF